MTASQRGDDVIANDGDEHKASTIPLVRLTLKNITYKPVVKTHSSPSSFRQSAKSLFQSKTKKNDDDMLSKENNDQKNHNTTRKVILKNVSPPSVEPYTVQGWMGPSGMREKI